MTPKREWRAFMRMWALQWKAGRPKEEPKEPRRRWRYGHWYDEIRRVVAAGAVKSKDNNPDLAAAIRCRERSQ